MAHGTKESLASQVQSEFQQLEAEDGLPFRALLDEERLMAALQRRVVLVVGSTETMADTAANQKEYP
jgi:hypothetical protein